MVSKLRIHAAAATRCNLIWESGRATPESVISHACRAAAAAFFAKVFLEAHYYYTIESTRERPEPDGDGGRRRIKVLFSGHRFIAMLSLRSNLTSSQLRWSAGAHSALISAFDPNKYQTRVQAFGKCRREHKVQFICFPHFLPSCRFVDSATAAAAAGAVNSFPYPLLLKGAKCTSIFRDADDFELLVTPKT